MGVRPGYRLFCGLPAGDWTIPVEEYMDITWIVYKDFTAAVAINGSWCTMVKIIPICSCLMERQPFVSVPPEREI